MTDDPSGQQTDHEPEMIPAAKANSIPECSTRSTASSSKMVNLPLCLVLRHTGFLCLALGFLDQVKHGYPMDRSEKDRVRLLWVVPNARKKGNGHKFKYWEFSVNTRKHICTVRMAKLSQSLPEQVVEYPFFKIFKALLDLVLGNLCLRSILEQRG